MVGHHNPRNGLAGRTPLGAGSESALGLEMDIEDRSPERPQSDISERRMDGLMWLACYWKKHKEGSA
jgi:hypothetical protein